MHVEAIDAVEAGLATMNALRQHLQSAITCIAQKPLQVFFVLYTGPVQIDSLQGTL